MIFFFCPDCREELEAEESIRGMKMKCPACHKEIEVPAAGVKVSTRSQRKDERDAAASGEPLKGSSKFIVTMLVAGTVGLFGIMGAGYMIQKKAREEAERKRPSCSACSAKGKVQCTKCGGAKTQSCKECTGTGKRKNFKNEDEDCFVCGGKGVNACLVCSGKGEYDCAGCGGKGRLDPAPEPGKK